MLSLTKKREIKRIARHQRIRTKVFGTSECPRLCVHRSLKNLQAQIIDDSQKKVLYGKSTLAKDFRAKLPYGGNVNAATLLGEYVAHEVLQKGIKKVCFDRGGYMYQGRVKAFADAARKVGLQF